MGKCKPNFYLALWPTQLRGFILSVWSAETRENKGGTPIRLQMSSNALKCPRTSYLELPYLLCHHSSLGPLDALTSGTPVCQPAAVLTDFPLPTAQADVHLMHSDDRALISILSFPLFWGALPHTSLCFLLCCSPLRLGDSIAQHRLRDSAILCLGDRNLILNRLLQKPRFLSRGRPLLNSPLMEKEQLFGIKWELVF